MIEENEILTVLNGYDKIKKIKVFFNFLQNDSIRKIKNALYIIENKL